LQRELARYQYLGRPDAKRTAQQSHMEDHGHVVQIRAAAADLSLVRRWLVDRRLRKTIGEYWTNLAIDLPTDADHNGSFSAWLAASLKDGEVRSGRGPFDGLLHRSYMKPPGDVLQEQLRRNLKRLAACR
jgi:hypothetical protein